MPNYTSLNGNSTGSNDPAFIHFTDEQSGVLLPSIPGYPSWLPQLQLTATGRLCFWNFPSVFKKIIVSDPKNAGTYNFLRDAKNGGWTPNVGIPADLGTNGPDNAYVWGACNTFLTNTGPVDPAIAMKKNIPNSWDYPSFAPDRNGGTSVQDAMGWMFLNIQFYVNRYIAKPFNIENAGNNFWPARVWFGNMQHDGKLQEYLSNINFLIPLYDSPGFWEKMGAVIPVIVAGVLTIVSVGAATPALAAAIAIAGADAKLQTAQMAKAQAAAQQVLINAQSANTETITSDVKTIASSAGSIASAPDAQKKYIFFAIIIIIIVSIILIAKK